MMKSLVSVLLVFFCLFVLGCTSVPYNLNVSQRNDIRGTITISEITLPASVSGHIYHFFTKWQQGSDVKYYFGVSGPSPLFHDELLVKTNDVVSSVPSQKEKGISTGWFLLPESIVQSIKNCQKFSYQVWGTEISVSAGVLTGIQMLIE